MNGERARRAGVRDISPPQLCKAVWGDTSMCRLPRHAHALRWRDDTFAHNKTKGLVERAAHLLLSRTCSRSPRRSSSSNLGRA